VILRAEAMFSTRLLVAVLGVGVVASLTVTATVLLPDAVGVPLITPVEALIVKPGGKPVADQL
jgi:hypothetical protein